MASGNGNNHKNGAGGDCCSFCGAKRSDVEIMFQGIDGANICNKCIENGYRIIVENSREVTLRSIGHPSMMAPQH